MIVIKANLGDLEDVDVTTQSPFDQDVLTYDGTQSKWVPKKTASVQIESQVNTYVIELERWGIRNDESEALSTTIGINESISWAKSNGYNHIILPKGTYLLRMDPTTLSCIVLYSGLHFEMAHGCVLKLETNSSPWYRIIDVTGLRNVRITGGEIQGDKKTHQYQINVRFERGGVNADGSLNDDRNFIRSEVIDRYEHPGLLKQFRLWKIEGVNATGYSFYQYKDTVSASTFVNYRDNGGFAPSSPTGRGWFKSIEGANKMVFAIDISSSPLTDEQIAHINAKVDSQGYTHEWGQGIEIKGSHHIEVEGVNIHDCTGDALSTGWLMYRLNPGEYTQEDMGSNIFVHNCEFHHCRRQGVSLTGSNDTYIFNNKIHHIGYADDGVTVDGTAPMFGIDIESMWSESNIPTWRPELDQEGLELNTRIYVYNNYVYQNARGHFVNADGIHVVVEGNLFEGYNVGGISSYQNNWYVKYLNNTFVGCELAIKGDNFVNGAVCQNGNIKLQDVRGAFITNCQIKNGRFYGSSIYGYFGTPNVDPSTGTFSYSLPHGMGNGAKISFEEWLGKVPSGISIDKLYYTVNVTSTSFQVSETKGGAPVSITDAGQQGFNISRYDYGRCYISNVTVEREWRNDNALTPNFQVIMTGGVLKDITVKNYEVYIQAPRDYVGRPITVEGLTVIEGGVNLDACHIRNGSFMRAKKGILGGDISFSSLQNTKRRIEADNCLFDHVGVNMGNVVLRNSMFKNSYIQKSGHHDSLASKLIQCYLDRTKLNLRWLTVENGMIIVRCIFDQVTVDTNQNTKMIENVTL